MMNSMTDFIDIYCERTGPEFWSEPINAITNAAFLIAAFFALKTSYKHQNLNIKTGLLVVLIAAMGIGSFLFHTFATPLSMILDIIPILAFQIAFLVLYARDVMALRGWQVGVLLAGFVGTMVMFGAMPREWLNGSLGYAPALLFVAGFGLYHYRTRQRERFLLLGVAALFAVSLMFRSIDEALCPAIPLGTHFLWHVCNALVLYGCVRAYVLATRS